VPEVICAATVRLSGADVLDRSGLMMAARLVGVDS
jgi:hypothetical protein